MEEPAPRMFWPRDIWSKYATTLEDFKEPANRTKAVQCLNHMVRIAQLARRLSEQRKESVLHLVKATGSYQSRVACLPPAWIGSEVCHPTSTMPTCRESEGGAWLLLPRLSYRC